MNPLANLPFPCPSARHPRVTVVYLLLTILPQPPPPAWLVESLEKFKEEGYANDLFEGVMRYSAVNELNDSPLPMPQPGAPIPPNMRFWFLPRIRCLDCPGKLYTPGPDMSAANFTVHLKNRAHREKVDNRLKALEEEQEQEN